MTAVCYKMKMPVHYNNNTVCDTFLSYYTFKSIEEAQKDCEALNHIKPSTLWNGNKIDWEKIAYFFATEQDKMED